MNTIPDWPFVSVIIPVLNDPHRLMLCLAALERQTYPSDRYEVIVIDNGSDKPITGLVNAFPHAFDLYQSEPGSDAARNKGLEAARGAVLAFTDADCIPELDWLEKGVSCLINNPYYDRVGGEVAVFYKDPSHPTSVELYEKVTAFPQKTYIETGQYSVTANMFTYRRVFDAVGPFRSGLKISGDREWGIRAAQAGYTIHYAKEVQVAHPARYSFNQLARKHTNVIRDYRQVYSLPTFMKAMIREAIPPWREALAFLSDERLHGTGQRARAILALLYFRYRKVLTRVWLLIQPPRRAATP